MKRVLITGMFYVVSCSNLFSGEKLPQWWLYERDIPKDWIEVWVEDLAIDYQVFFGEKLALDGMTSQKKIPIFRFSRLPDERALEKIRGEDRVEDSYGLFDPLTLADVLRAYVHSQGFDPDHFYIIAKQRGNEYKIFDTSWNKNKNYSLYIPSFYLKRKQFTFEIHFSPSLVQEHEN